MLLVELSTICDSMYIRVFPFACLTITIVYFVNLTKASDMTVTVREATSDGGNRLDALFNFYHGSHH